MKTYTHVLSFVREHPWAVMPSVLATIHEIVGLRLQGTALDEDAIQARLDAAAAANGPRRGGNTSGDVAIIPVYGLLVPRYDFMAAMSGATAMETLRADIKAALADPDIGTIVLDVDSPGGVVDMIPETAALLRQARAQKPVVAVANTLAASAAYYLASQADEVVASPSAEVGSIGVYTWHEDWSGAYEQAGVDVSIIKAGRYKFETNEYAPLSEEAQSHLQEGIDYLYDMFVKDVARGRGVKVSDVRDGFGEGRVLRAEAARDAGMVDRIETLEETVSRVLKRPPKSRDGSRALDGTTTVHLEDSESVESFLEATLDEVEAGGPDDRFEFEQELYQRRAVTR